MALRNIAAFTEPSRVYNIISNRLSRKWRRFLLFRGSLRTVCGSLKGKSELGSLLYTGDNVSTMRSVLADEIVQLTVTSPPYDNLRKYKGFSWNFELVARELWRVTKPGGVLVWVVADATIDGNETGSSFRQALFFKEIGFNLHDTMIWDKGAFSATGSLKVRYASVFEYMFVFSKGFPSVFNALKDRKNIHVGDRKRSTVRQRDGSLKQGTGKMHQTEFGQRFNVWRIPQQTASSNRLNWDVDVQPISHPAPFPEALARDHILSWSNAGDLVFDPFLGSGTTGKMAVLNHRDFIGIEINEQYLDSAAHRIPESLKAGIFHFQARPKFPRYRKYSRK